MKPATLKQAAKVLEQIAAQDPSTDRVQQLLNGYFADFLKAPKLPDREAFRKFLGLIHLMPELMELTGIVLPELSVTFDDRIAAGGYDWRDSDITEKRFSPTLPAGPRQLVLAHFNKVMTSPAVEAWAAENGYEVVLIDDLLAVGSHAEYKELQRQFPIIQLGSYAEVLGEWFVPCLDRGPTERSLCLHFYSFTWHKGCRFLLGRK